MDQVHVIRHKFLVEGHSARSVANEMGISRNTVSKYLTVSEPTRKVVRRSKPSPVTEMVGPRIDELLEEWKHRTTKKQRITGTRLHRQLAWCLRSCPRVQTSETIWPRNPSEYQHYFR